MPGYAEIHHFTYGWYNPLVAFGLAFLGSMLGLNCTARARAARTRGRRARWLAIAAVAIGGTGVWLMHFMALLGFEVPGSATRYDPVYTLGSVLLAVVPVGLGLFLARPGRTSTPRVLVGGVVTGLGLLGMHYIGLVGLRVAGTMEFERRAVAVSVGIAVAAATLTLWFTTFANRWETRAAAATAMAAAFCGMHYAGMAAVRVRLSAEPVVVDGLRPFALIVPITLVYAIALLVIAISALQAMTEEEFGGETTGRHRDGAQAEQAPVAPSHPLLAIGRSPAVATTEQAS